MTPLFSKDRKGYFVNMPIMMTVMDEHVDIDSKIYYDTEHGHVIVDHFETPSHGLTNHLNTLLVIQDGFSHSIANSIQLEIDLENEHSAAEARA